MFAREFSDRLRIESGRKAWKEIADLKNRSRWGRLVAQVRAMLPAAYRDYVGADWTNAQGGHVKIGSRVYCESDLADAAPATIYDLVVAVIRRKVADDFARYAAAEEIARFARRNPGCIPYLDETREAYEDLLAAPTPERLASFVSLLTESRPAGVKPYELSHWQSRAANTQQAIDAHRNLDATLDASRAAGRQALTRYEQEWKNPLSGAWRRIGNDGRAESIEISRDEFQRIGGELVIDAELPFEGEAVTVSGVGRAFQRGGGWYIYLYV